MYQYIYPLEPGIPSDQFHRTIRTAPYDLTVTHTGSESYASAKNITVEATEYLEGASSSDTNNLFLLFETKKTSEQLAAIKTILNSRIAAYNS